MHDDVETLTQPARRAAEVLARGTAVGRYVVIDRLGAGAMGVVYRAYDPDLDRRVALKLVRTITAESRARMVREAQALAKVSHPNIVQVFDVGVHDDTVFITMELIEGQTLWAWARAAKPTWRALLARLIEAGRGLAAAHAVGLVHRDFKPQNAIVGTDGRVRVLDFGVARLADEPVETDDSLPSLRSSKLTGTPVYMAPEQQRPGLLDARADQFSFAVTCWELLHGERPFPGENARAYLEASRAGKLRAPPASSKVPARITRILTRALATAPADRYRSMDDLLAALAVDPRRWRIAVGGLAAIAALWLVLHRGGEMPCEDAARHMAGVWDDAVAAKLSTALRATNASYAADTADKAKAALDARAAAWIAMHREACRATEVTGEQSAALLDLRMGCLERRREELRALIAQLVATSNAAGAIDAIERLPSVDACADREALAAVIPLPSDPTTRAAIANARAELNQVEALDWTGQWPAARSRAEALQGVARKLAWAPLVAETALARAQAERDAGGFAAAEQALGEVVPAAAQAHLDSVGTTAWSELAWVVGYEEERPLEGLAFATAAEASALRDGAGPSVLAGIAHVRANILAEKGDQDAALREAERALALFADPLERVNTLNTIGMIRSNQTDWAHAEVALREALVLRQRGLGAKHPMVADALDNLGVVRYHQGALDEARQDYEQALALRLAALGPRHRDVGTSHNNLGGLLLDTGDLRGAEEHLTAALSIYEEALGADHVDLAIPLTNLGDLAIRRGDFAAALGFCRRALAIDEKAARDASLDFGCIGEAALGAGDRATAKTNLDKALAGKLSDPADLARIQAARARLRR